MSITKEKKKQVIQSYQIHAKDAGSSEVQIALLTERINDLTGHLKAHQKDKHSQRGLMTMVERRKRLLAYLAKVNPDSYAKLIQKLKIRK
ncbi:MAG: 30S ribosomal protein S15 [Candidatus Omnitrophica bacterium CG11_big_fil_rev_8_21_14_0_20_45_26]|uniref:Small ribosomal subunit protein uS15 n=1 Tax=Candidatus Abzuiibacterium crystallinum TaxID=1974748 RepID=A0A2H0LPF9_9BACT|nr:MAG: 30S ribosomal protein S15 [Candidatus Omnitrophica bacterium CG11_big_fil_rev_8_21_14_0_20_45_26]PIW64354.1 MAG: 30S ribosomal protein S15 [Candidatus Omnitrophica bacterium CG12_big_fil_rev_8_21_14_0_65_45_16]